MAPVFVSENWGGASRQDTAQKSHKSHRNRGMPRSCSHSGLRAPSTTGYNGIGLTYSVRMNIHHSWIATDDSCAGLSGV